MGNRVYIRTRGFPRLLRRLDGAPAHIAQALEDNAAAVAEHLIVPRARELCPKGPSGKLEASIRAIPRFNRPQQNADIAIIADTAYAGVIHFGWDDRNIAAQPFILEAVDEARDELAPHYRQALDGMIRQLTAGA